MYWFYHLGSINSRNSTHPEQWERRIEKMDEVGQCAYSAGPPEDFPTDNDAQLSSHRGERQREREEKCEQTHLSVSKVKALRQHSPPDCAINPLWRLEGGRNIPPCSCYCEKETLTMVCLDYINVFGSGQQQ